LLTLLGPAIFGWLLPNTPFNPYVLITVWNAGISVVSVLVLQLFRARQQAQYFVTFSLVDFSLTTALIILLVVGLRLGALGSLWGQLLAASGDGRAGPVGAGAGRRAWLLLAPAAAIAGLWPAAAALPAGHLGAERLRPHRAGRAGIARGAGLYTLGYQFGVLLNIIAMALNNAWQPFFYQNAAEGGHDA
jgi:hypothetical protein